MNGSTILLRRRVMLGAALTIAWVLSSTGAHAATVSRTFRVTEAESSGPPHPANNSIVADVYNQLGPTPPPTLTHSLTATLHAFNPIPVDPCRLFVIAGDRGQPCETKHVSALSTPSSADPIRLDTTFDFFLEPMLTSVPLLGVPVVQFGDSICDIFFQLLLGPMVAIPSHTLDGTIGHPEVFSFSNETAASGSLERSPIRKLMISGETLLFTLGLTAEWNAVSEPSSWVLLEMSSALLTVGRRRRRRKMAA